MTPYYEEAGGGGVGIDYGEFLLNKAQGNNYGGFACDDLPEFLFPFQTHLVDWALRKGRAAIFADCGLGKTPMQLAWADAIAKQTGKPVLVLTPLAVAAQTVREGAKFGIDCKRSKDGGHSGGAPIVVANYERLHYLQLDVIERCLVLWSNPGDVVLTPFMGVGSEVYSAVKAGRRGVGMELKPSYYRQAVKNIHSLADEVSVQEGIAFADA